MKKLIIFSALCVFSLYARNKQWEYCQLIIIYQSSKTNEIFITRFSDKLLEIDKKVKKKVENLTQMSQIPHALNLLGEIEWNLVSANTLKENKNIIYFNYLKREVKKRR